MVSNSNKSSNGETDQKDNIILKSYVNKDISKNAQEQKLLSHENKNLKRMHNTQGRSNFVDSNNKTCKEVSGKNMRNESSCKTGDENNVNNKNGSYMNFLKKNVRSVISNITGRLILGRHNDTEFKNRQLNKQYENSNRKGENKINEKKETSGELKRDTNNIINIKEENNESCNSNKHITGLRTVSTNSDKKEYEKFNSTIKNNNEGFSPLKINKISLTNNDKQFKQWNTKGITNNTPKLNNISNSSISNLKRGADFTKYKSIVSKKASPIHENIRHIAKRNIQDIIKKKLNENNKPGKYVEVIPTKKMNYQFPLTTYNSINQKIIDNLKKAPPPNAYIPDRKVKMTTKIANDSKIRSNLNNNIKEYKNKSLLLKGLNKNEKIPYKKSSYTPTYMSNRNKKLTQHEDLKIITNDDTFHKNLKKMLIDTIMNPENEEKNNKVIMSNKKDSSPFLKRHYNNVIYKNSPINRGQNNLKKNISPIETKQEMLKRYSTAVRNRNSIIIKSNNTPQYSNTNTSNAVIINDVEDIVNSKNKKQKEDPILIDEEVERKENIRGYKVIGRINSNADMEDLKRYRTNKNIFEELIRRNLNKDENKHVVLKSIENFKASSVSPLNRTIDKDGKNKNEEMNTPINNILKREKYQNIKEELYDKKEYPETETDKLPLYDTSLSKISNLLPNKIIFSSLDKEYPIVKKDPNILVNKDINSFPPKNEVPKETIQNVDTHINECNKFDEALKGGQNMEASDATYDKNENIFKNKLTEENYDGIYESDQNENGDAREKDAIIKSCNYMGVVLTDDEEVEDESKGHDEKIISNSICVSNNKMGIDGSDLHDDKSEDNSNQSNELDVEMDNNINLKNSEKNKSLNRISLKRAAVDIDNDIDEIVAIFKETIIDKINDEKNDICVSNIIEKEDSHISVLPYNEDNMNTLNSSTFVPIPKGDKMGSNTNELLHNEDNTNAHIDAKLEESRFDIEKNMNLQKIEGKECEKLEYIKKHIPYTKTQETKYLIKDTYNDSKKFGITYCLGSDENETNSVTLLNDNKVLHKNKMCVNFSKHKVGKYSNSNNKIGNKIFSLNKYPNKIILRRKKYIMSNFSFNLKKNYNLSLNNQNVNFLKIKKGKFYDKNEKFHTKKNKIDVINLETQIGSNTRIDNSSGYITKNSNIYGNNNTKKRKNYLPLEKNNTQNYEQVRSKKINSMHSLQACVLSQMDDEIKDSQEILTTQSVIYKIEDGVTENGGEKKVEVVNLVPSEDSEQNMHTKENASTVEVHDKISERSHSDTHETVFNSLQSESVAFENLYNDPSSKKGIFFYEHEWVNIILQLINNNNLGLAENLMILLFQKEEQLYKSFINDEVECKSSSDENVFVKSEECLEKSDETVSSFCINNQENNKKQDNNRKKEKSSKNLSNFMQQICMKCPLDWPLLDIGMLIIVSQIVCYIFNYNKIQFFFDACRMFEKYCIGILLNSSLICTKKNGSHVFMFEHEFFYQIVIPKNYKISKEVIKYHSRYLKNDYFIQEKTILDYIFLALAYYITISQNLKDYIENNNIIYYLSFFHKGIGSDEVSGSMSDIFLEKKLKRRRTEERSGERSDGTTGKPFGRTIFSDTTHYIKNDCSIKHRHSECMHKYKRSSDYINKEKNRNKTYEKKRKKRLSILRTPRCIKKLKKIKGISKIEKNSDIEELNSSSQLNQDGWIKRSESLNNIRTKKENIENNLKKKRTKYSKIEKNKLNCLFKNRKIDTIVKYHTKTKFEKLLCLIIIEIFNLIYDNRKYTIENILIIRKFFRIFLNYAQKKFISLSIYIYSKKSKKKSLHTSQNQDCKDYFTGAYCNNGEDCGGYDFRIDETDSFIPMPSYIYENYYNMWVWIERIFCEHFYQINNMLFNFFSFEIDSKKINVDYSKLELINRNIKRFSSLQKRNSFILKEYWTVFGLKQRNNEPPFSVNNNLKNGVKNSSDILEEGNEFLPGSVYLKKLLPSCYSFEEWSGKNKLFYELEKTDQEYDMLCSYFLSSIHCICKTYLSMDEIPSFLHLKNENNIILDNSVLSSNGMNLSFTKIELKKECNGDDKTDVTLKGDKDKNQNEEEIAKNLNECDEKGVLWLRQLKKRLKVYDIQWHEEYEKKYFNLLNCINLLKKQFKKNKLFYKIMKNNISSIWLNKIQIYLQYIQIAINCKFVLGYTYNNIYLFIKKNYSFVITIIEHYMGSKMGVTTAATSVEKAGQASEDNDKDGNNDVGPNNDEDCPIRDDIDESGVSSILDFPIEIGEISIDENFLLTAWEIANFYFSILYYKLELKTILTEILKWITFFEKIGTKYSQELFKFRCSSYILHILILTNKYEAAQKVMKHISCHYIKNGDEENREDFRERRCILAYLKKNKVMDKRSLESLSILGEETGNDNEDKKGGSSMVENILPHFEKKKILLSHIINKCYLYNKWVNYMIMKYNKVLIYLLKRKNIVKLILFNKRNVSILMNGRKEKILIKNISKHMIKLQNVLLFLYYLSIKLYKSYYYHSSILHNNTSKQILEASKYLNIKIKKKQIIMNYIASFQNFQNCQTYKSGETNVPMSYIASTPMYVSNLSEQFPSATLFKSTSLSCDNKLISTNAPTIPIPSNWDIKTERDDTFVFTNADSKVNVRNDSNCTSSSQNNDDMFYLHALILSIQIQYTLSICIILCSDLFIAPRKVNRLMKMKNCVKKKKLKSANFVLSLFSYKLLCKHYRIINGHAYKKRKERCSKEDSVTSPIENGEEENNPKLCEDKFNDLTNKLNMYNTNCSTEVETNNEHLLSNKSFINNNTNECYNNDHDDELDMPSQESLRQIDENKISEYSINMGLKQGSNKKREGYKSDTLNDKLINDFEKMNDVNYLSDFVPGKYENYKKNILKKKNYNNIYENLFILRKNKIKNVITKKNNYHVLVKISTWLSKNSVSQLTWIAEKLFKMCLPEMLCVVLGLQANMLVNKNILTNVKRIDRIMKLCSESPQLVYFSTESLKKYKNKKNCKIYNKYFKIYKKSKKIFLEKKKEINNSNDIMNKVCEYFLKFE
ncbi:conserved Plasmodium protein, unknown function [Plasmodium chabaudi adami]|uniref:Uncharacterized protein n=1 Tax=Plasmodium chabaudi adami TaxID=5826 RepID=A0A1C6YGD4_PLACE|nr:conserved Plasmodium protein, unknown function [Plasmodium chabaudi adami]